MLVSTPHLVARHTGVSDLTPETPEPLRGGMRGGDADSSAESDGEAADGACGNDIVNDANIDDDASTSSKAGGCDPANYFTAIDAETDDVMKSRVEDSSRYSYAVQNAKFIMWLFDNLEHYRVLLEPTAVEGMMAAHTKDRQARTKSGQPSKKRDHLRDFLRMKVNAIDPNVEVSMPVKLHNLTFAIFARYTWQPSRRR